MEQKTNELMRLLNEFNPKNVKEAEEWFRNVARILLTSVKWKGKENGTKYLLTEIEFYCFSQGMEDPYAYYKDIDNKKSRKNLTRLPASCCFHPSGMDITFGNKGKTCGGILLRNATLLPVENEGRDSVKDIEGPLVLRGKLFKEIPYKELKESNNKTPYLLEDLIEPLDESIHTGMKQMPRYNLKAMENDKFDFRMKPYRFFVFEKKIHKGKESFSSHIFPCS